MADALDSSNAGLYSPSSCHWCNIGSPKFAPARISSAEMVSSSATNSCALHRHRPAPGELLQARALTSAVTTLHDFLLASPPRLQRFPPNMKSESPFSLSPNILSFNPMEDNLPWKEINNSLLAWDCTRVCLIWLRPLLQRCGWND